MAQRSETVLNDWAAGFTAREISERQKVPLNSVKRYIAEARRAADPGAAARNASRFAHVPVPASLRRASEAFVEVAHDAAELPCQLHRDADAAALATLIKVHGSPEKVTTLRPAVGSFRRPDSGQEHKLRRGLVLNAGFGDPPAGRSALDQRRAG